ncbi:hypothetical protein [Nonomuraea rhodomycinica]|nr:hypothetical protein [Nonomuraea rhodomycinica]
MDELPQVAGPVASSVPAATTDAFALAEPFNGRNKKAQKCDR